MMLILAIVAVDLGLIGVTIAYANFVMTHM